MQESKLDRALDEEPRHIERKNYKNPGEWTSVLLERALTYWEDGHRMLYASAVSGFMAKKISKSDLSEFIKWKKFRKLLIEQSHPDSREWEYEEFTPKDDPVIKISEEARKLNSMRKLEGSMKVGVSQLGSQTVKEAPVATAHDYIIAPTLLEFTKSSRRIFAIDSVLQDLFSEISFTKTIWNEVSMPFSSFAIELAKPIRWQEKTSDGQTVVAYIESLVVVNVEIDGRKKVWCLPLLTNTGKDANFLLTDATRKIFDEAGKSAKHMMRAFELQLFILSNMSTEGNPYHFLPAIDLDELITNPNISPAQNTVRKIIASMCMYLTISSANQNNDASISRTPLQQVPTIGSTDTSNIFSVSATSTLSTNNFNETTLRQSIPRNISFHHRRKHFRRPPGSPPDAEKTIEVKATTVGKLQPDTLAPGSVTKIK